MVCAFQGWNDAGDAASSAVSFLASALDARRFARIDSEEFYDFQANRPCVQFDEGNAAGDRLADGRGVRGPRPKGAARPRARPGRRAVDALARLQLAPRRPRRSARRADGRLVGRAPGRCAPHPPGGDDRATPPTPRWWSAWGCRARPTRGPRGSSASCTSACAEAGLPSASLWAGVPHYVAAAANPKAALALVRRVEGLIGVSVDVSDLESAAADYERQVGLAVQSDPDIQAFVERLEQAAESEEESIARGRPLGGHRSPGNSSASCASGDSREVATRPRRVPRARYALGGRADDAVVADRARRMGRAWARIPGRGSPRRPRAPCP